jgi:hypothetical protein
MGAFTAGRRFSIFETLRFPCYIAVTVLGVFFALYVCHFSSLCNCTRAKHKRVGGQEKDGKGGF